MQSTPAHPVSQTRRFTRAGAECPVPGASADVTGKAAATGPSAEFSIGFEDKSEVSSRTRKCGTTRFKAARKTLMSAKLIRQRAFSLKLAAL